MADEIDLIAATEKSIEAANLDAIDAGAVEALRALARKIHAWDTIVQFAIEDIEGEDSTKTRPAVPQNDNVSLSAYLKYCDQLGLSPAGRKALGLKKEQTDAKAAKLTALRGGRSA